MREVGGGKATVISIAHRVEAVRGVEEFIVLGRGRLERSGKVGQGGGTGDGDGKVRLVLSGDGNGDGDGIGDKGKETKTTSSGSGSGSGNGSGALTPPIIKNQK